MELFTKHFNELTLDELYEILRLRNEVFVVEQNCPYQDLDDRDKDSIHIFIKEDNKIVSYCRVIKKGVDRNEKIGRVLSTIRRKGYASKVVEKAIEVARKEYGSKTIELGAQVYAKSLYEKLGFKEVGDVYLEDDIPHIKMIIDLSK